MTARMRAGTAFFAAGPILPNVSAALWPHPPVFIRDGKDEGQGQRSYAVGPILPNASAAPSPYVLGRIGQGQG